MWLFRWSSHEYQSRKDNQVQTFSPPLATGKQLPRHRHAHEDRRRKRRPGTHYRRGVGQGNGDANAPPTLCLGGHGSAHPGAATAGGGRAVADPPPRTLSEEATQAPSWIKSRKHTTWFSCESNVKIRVLRSIRFVFTWKWWSVFAGSYVSTFLTIHSFIISCIHFRGNLLFNGRKDLVWHYSCS